MMLKQLLDEGLLQSHNTHATIRRGWNCATLAVYKGQEPEVSTQDWQRRASPATSERSAMLAAGGSGRTCRSLEQKSHAIFRPAAPVKTAFLQAMMPRLMSWLHRALYVTGFGAGACPTVIRPIRARIMPLLVRRFSSYKPFDAQSVTSHA